MAVRVTQQVVEAIETAQPAVRITQQVVEAIELASTAQARVSQIVAEVIIPAIIPGGGWMEFGLGA
jgi:hypothetical protein